MDKKWYWGIIFFTVAVNVIMLQLTTRAYLGREFEMVLPYSIVGVVMAGIAFFTFLQWKKVEYKEDEK
ncbi:MULTISPECIES: hypothetical protein [Bacillaceae]|uniref:Uncharacterized protein n=1 Tax=Evansella alkalicola TaxID=745819 RepID=A0ABS6JTA4_9BACI|nr:MULTISPECIES: hypothetical protein [Bacillaceae]MBU9721811.1 hypothetical protein [Bacillus alkalicola]